MNSALARRIGHQDTDRSILEIPFGEQSVPYNVDAEAAVLGAAIRDAETLELLEGLTEPTDFFRATHGLIWSVILEMRRDGAKIDTISLADELTRRGQFQEIGGDDTIAWIMDRAQVENAVYHAGVLRNLAKLRECIRIGEEMIESARARAMAGDDLIGHAEERLRKLAMDDRGGGTVTAGELMPIVIDRIARRSRGELVGVRTPWWELNAIVCAFEPGDLIVLGGRTSQGKSAMAVNIVEALSVSNPDPQPTLYVSLEMSNESVVTRMISSQGAVKAQHLRVGVPMTSEEYARFERARRQIESSPFHFIRRPKMQISRVVPDVRAACRRHRPALVAIDHIQMMHGDPELTSTAEKLGDICVRLKNLARDLNVPILLLSQINRAAVATADARPTLANLKSSGGIEENADVVLLLHRPKDNPTLAEVEVAKQRNGPTGSFNLMFNLEYSRFDDMPTAQPALDAF